MTNYVIVGAGAAGLYTAYRLLKGGVLNPGDTLNLFEWSDRPGGRIYTYTFPPPVGSNGLYCEFGGMRFATDSKNFPNNPGNITEGHVLVQQMIIALGLQNKVVPFLQSSNRLYYLRGQNVYENSIKSVGGLPYHFNAEFNTFLANVPKPYTADNILGQIATVFAPDLGSANADRAKWCSYYATGTVGANGATTSFPPGTPVRDIGYWNLLYDQLGDEGFDYVADGTGYESNVINWNAADAMQANNDYGSTSVYSRLDGGYSLLFQALADQVTALAANYPGSGINYGTRLIRLEESTTDNTTSCYFAMAQEAGNLGSLKIPTWGVGDIPPGWPIKMYAADILFLALPRRALEMVAQGSGPNYMLNTPPMKYLLESSLDQAAIKVVMVFDQAWWLSTQNGGQCQSPPNLVWPTNRPKPPPSQWVGGATITDLPLRMIYYFGNNIPGGPGANGGPYVLLASYDDMNYSNFWRELEITGDYPVAPSQMFQPLTGPTSVPVDSPMAGLLLTQLADVHGIAVTAIPTPTAIYFQDWGQDPFGGGYHGWASHYNICQVMDYIRAPYQKVLVGSGGRQTYIVGSCYSFDQAWVEGAFCTAESVLQDFIGLPPLNPYIGNYKLICTA
jgi:Flavin containing amine oxidoreductase